MQPINFEGLGLCYYERGEYRAPKAGEFYLSGAIVAAYRQSRDGRSPYQIVRPTFKARKVTCYERGEAVNL